MLKAEHWVCDIQSGSLQQDPENLFHSEAVKALPTCQCAIAGPSLSVLCQAVPQTPKALLRI